MLIISQDEVMRYFDIFHIRKKIQQSKSRHPNLTCLVTGRGLWAVAFSAILIALRRSSSIFIDYSIFIDQ